jgi:chromosome segregation protein
VRLTKLELQGFKSFADSTDLHFEPGVTAIVGPNGCGKSNVSDAVRWVLGEQRARALRGAKMEEVIFQGSSARRPVNIAEVSLYFSNDDGSLPVPFREVVITRRLSRSGESEYLLNGSVCRLRDIHDMVRGTGLGADSGVVIEAKMIDALLSDRPDERRELFEEAAGVGLYRDRKRSTERRLEETTLDLARLDDLINEVQSQVRSLARQRKKAERFTELSARRFTVEIALAKREMAAWHGELAQLEARVRTLREEAPAAEHAAAAAEAARDAAHGARSAADAQRNELGRMVGDQRMSVQQLRAEIAVAEERQRNSLARRERAAAEHRQGGEFTERIRFERERAEREQSDLEQELAAATQALRADQVVEDQARAAVAAARVALEVAERDIRELQDRVHRARMEREAADREIQELARRSEIVRAEHEQVIANVEALSRELAQTSDAAEIAKAAAAQAEANAELARAAAHDARERDATARSEVLRAEEGLTATQAKLNALEALERERVGLAPATARLLDQRARFGDGAILGPLSDFLTAGTTEAGLIERFLGATVHAVLVRDQNAADAVRDWHAGANPGPLLLLPLDAAEVASVPGGQEMSLAVNAAPIARPWVQTLLGRVRALDQGAAFVDSRGAIWLPAHTTGPGPLRRRAEISELHQLAKEQVLVRDRATAHAEAVRADLEQAERKAMAATDAASLAARQARQAEDQQSAVARRHQRAEREATDANHILGQLTERREQLGARMSNIESDLASHHQVNEEHLLELDRQRHALSEAETAQDAAREARTQRQVWQAQAQARLEVARDRGRHLAEELVTAGERLASLQSELSTLDATEAELAAQLADWKLDLEAREATLQDAEARLAHAEHEVRESDDAARAAAHALDDARHKATASSEALHAAELRYTELSGRRQSIRERLETEWRKPLEELLESAMEVEADDEALRADAMQLRDQLDALGPVNALAIEEHEEEVKRLDFITTQRSDLTAARHSLQQAIREIDTTARELFLTTFAQVRENFRNIFMTLFGGGECDLRLENPESPLDGDIEIHASPRGKRTQRIHLLSSGERALVALSLLFGIFLTKPSPFCLLDEVDAPLDDQNIGRFVRMLNQFKQNTQFIVITHNPRTTTEAADAVFGVTMQEPGVSSLVSVRLRGGAIEEAIQGSVPATAGV